MWAQLVSCWPPKVDLSLTETLILYLLLSTASWWSGQQSEPVLWCMCQQECSGKGVRVTTLHDHSEPGWVAVLSLCAISGDMHCRIIPGRPVWWTSCFWKLVPYLQLWSILCIKLCYGGGEDVPFLNQLRIPKWGSLEPSTNCTAIIEMLWHEICHRINSLWCEGPHFIHHQAVVSPCCVEGHGPGKFRNGLSPLDLAKQFQLQHILCSNPKCPFLF